ncbi:DUF4190 domain-containing protein [Fodinicola acaciae]|uniref:DUF4190 domain-containing protein n=1 Tax=Fodinicola acaciae TaxID=2681555 RepID=UPI0013D89E85|nr:DUF4190 domain-containing protein [Fodinicola acaciae]
MTTPPHPAPGHAGKPSGAARFSVVAGAISLGLPLVCLLLTQIPTVFRLLYGGVWRPLYRLVGFRSFLPPLVIGAQISGILALVIGIVAVVFAIVGLSQTARHRNRPGRGAAVTGMILGIIAVVLFLVALVGVILWFVLR